LASESASEYYLANKITKIVEKVPSADDKVETNY